MTDTSLAEQGKALFAETRGAAEVAEPEPEDKGWKSRKLIITVSLLAAIMIMAAVGNLVLGQYDANGIWHGRLSEAGALHLVELATVVACGYLGINFLGIAATVAGQIFGSRK